MQYKFNSDEIEEQISHLTEKGITEFSIHDAGIAKNKKRVLRLINLIAEYVPDVFVSFLIDPSIIDRDLAVAATGIFCSFDIPLFPTVKGGKLLFDKKFYSNKARVLNDYGLVFGFQLTYAEADCDTLKGFMDRLDFAVQQYPNHIDFPQLEVVDADNPPKVTGIFSAKDIRYARDLAFACKVFYSQGRAVPWMLSVLKPLRIYPSKFFADFSEWQRCNNCDYKSGYNPENEGHKNIEKMQLLFLDVKYEEKNCSDLLPIVHDIVTINGAMSRLAGEGEEEIINTSYHPDDLLGPESLDLISFSENVCMEGSEVKIFAGEEGPDYQVLN